MKVVLNGCFTALSKNQTTSERFHIRNLTPEISTAATTITTKEATANVVDGNK